MADELITEDVEFKGETFRVTFTQDELTRQPAPAEPVEIKDFEPKAPGAAILDDMADQEALARKPPPKIDWLLCAMQTAGVRLVQAGDQ